MCGISVLISKHAIDRASNQLRAMTDLIQHRGPDDGGYVLFQSKQATPYRSAETKGRLNPLLPDGLSGQVALGHRRLSIVDLSAHGHQPMSDATGRYWIVYNGEVYNHSEIRSELKSSGIQFHSTSDTEVVLQSYIAWGKSCLDTFNGMFAFVIYDAHTDEIFAARDRFGIKPFYYWRSPEGVLAFASEIKQFTVLDGWRAELHGQAAYDFLVWGLSDHEEETHFVGVRQLRGGHFLQGAVHKVAEQPQPQKWYQLPIGQYEGSFKEASTAYRDLLNSSVRYRLMADVPVGSCLSGGLDSSSIVCLVNQQLQNASGHSLQKTFSAKSIHKQFDESEYMEAVLAGREIEAHYCTPQLNDVFDHLDEVIWHQDEPFGSTSIFAQWDVFKLAAQQGVKVMLDGQGADEQLAGYSRYFHARFHELLSQGRLFELMKELQACRQLHQLEMPLKRLLYNSVPGKALLMKLLRRSSSRFSHNWLNRDILMAVRDNPHDLPTPIQNPLLSLNYLQTTATNLPMLLRYEDRDSMAHSIEARVPFVDHRVIELCQTIPSDYKLSRGVTKRILREGLRGILPEKIRTRMSKLGFATPEEVWVQQDAPDQFRDALHHAVEVSGGILTPAAVDVGEAMIAGRRPFNFLLWRMIILGRWMERFFVALPAQTEGRYTIRG